MVGDGFLIAWTSRLFLTEDIVGQNLLPVVSKPGCKLQDKIVLTEHALVNQSIIALKVNLKYFELRLQKAEKCPSVPQLLITTKINPQSSTDGCRKRVVKNCLILQRPSKFVKKGL